MQLLVGAVGRLKRGPERDLVERYRERASKLGRSHGFRGLEIIEVEESRAREAERRKVEESIALANLLPARAPLVLLQETGENLGTAAFAEALGRWRDEGRPTTLFVIGGADGTAPSLRDRADLCLAFGKLTWPHQLVRIMLLEQLYRAVTVLAGHPYHRE
jgi:23S rRNA (pseudouridine1915-N3)-methyltransferase